MVFFMAGFALSGSSTARVALVSLGICFLIECSQLYRADWLEGIRSYRLGGLILGYGFLWRDLLSYTLGVMLGLLLEYRFLNAKLRA